MQRGNDRSGSTVSENHKSTLLALFNTRACTYQQVHSARISGKADISKRKGQCVSKSVDINKVHTHHLPTAPHVTLRMLQSQRTETEESCL
jgi:hypothetical protein